MTIHNPGMGLNERFVCSNCGNGDPSKYGPYYALPKTLLANGLPPPPYGWSGFKCHVCNEIEKYP